MIGKKLITKLLNNNHSVSILSRKPRKIKNVKTYLWDVYKQEIDSGCMSGIDTIIHLAGEGIADSKWTKERKQQIIDSRVKSTQLLYKAIKDQNATVKNFISSSAVGYYGHRDDEILTEESPAGKGFLAECCMLWEEAVDEGEKLDLRIVKIRTGFVLGKDEGALPAIERPIKFFVGAPLGSGQQWIPWIHINDIVNIYVTAAENENYSGIYNGGAPYPVTNETLTNSIAKKLHRPVWPLNVPEKVLKMILGQMSAVTTISTNTSAQKLLDEEFQFEYTHLDDALNDLYKR